MVNRSGMIREQTLSWLLEEENPSVRYLTLKDLCGRADEDAEVRRAKAAIATRGLVPEILQRQGTDAYEATLGRFYTRKYQGLVWQLILLAELRAEVTPTLRGHCEYLLEHAQERTAGGFSQNTSARVGGGRISEVIPCLTGNLVFALLRLGYQGDERLESAIAWLVGHMRLNDGVLETPQDPPYDRYEICWGRHTCLMGVVKTVKALAELPASDRTPEILTTLRRCVEFLLIHHICRRSHNPRRLSKPGWLKLSFPLMYQTDILEILDVLVRLGVRDPRMEEAVGIVRGKMNERGRWCNENDYVNQRLLVQVEHSGEESKWLTLRALRMLEGYATLVHA